MSCPKCDSGNVFKFNLYEVGTELFVCWSCGNNWERNDSNPSG